ncbi:MAG TPA: hemerythrin family protein [Syntrophomonadaceae bacterium]|nr:hemerythrin family protein [Syntrophomonadaceae bacterium]
MIQWKENYSIGVAAIDEQHQKLFEIANRAYVLLKNGLLLDKYDQIIAIFEELRTYTVYHFNSEEAYMASIQYRKLLSHKVYHDDFIEKVNSIDFDQVDEKQDQYLMDILNFVGKWIEEHILGHDKRIVLG